MKRSIVWCGLMLAAAGVHAQSALPFMRDQVGDRWLPPPFGIGVDIFTMDQDYQIDSLQFTLPGVSLPDPSVLEVKNEILHTDVKLDVWLFPFLNVFGIFGHIEGDTLVDLGNVPITIPGLPIAIRTLPVEYSGQVYGGGATLAYGGEHWFASVTGTYAETDLSGDFDSSVDSLTWQPRVGYVNGSWQFFAGGYFIDAEERHTGVFALPGVGGVPFDVQLSSDDGFSPSAGVHYYFGDTAEATLEFGGGDRDITLLNLALRF